MPCERHHFLVLHLREGYGRPWTRYTNSPYAVPDHQVPGASKGFATFQKLRQHGWTLISSEQARSSPSLVMAQSHNSQI
jgi:hypothetical protein